MRFTDSFIDQVRNSVSIVGLIQGYLRLRKSGKEYAALCPFHQEKTPSFMVSETKQIFKCFGCGEGGDVFKFVMLMEHLTFPESVRLLAERHGIPLPRESREMAEESGRSRLLEAMELARSFFCQSLRAHPGALEYLGSRQLEPQVRDRFSLGYAPGGGQLLARLERAGFSRSEALECGLAVQSEEGRCYEKFRRRIIFPITDLAGRTIAFGGRILGDGVPKYLNSPDTRLYKKSRHLYPLFQAREEIRKRDFAILVEGYFDCLVPIQAGIGNVVASLGTSLTEDQVQLLGRYTRNVVLNFDPDSAGTSAALRSIDLFLERGFRVNVLSLPAGEDPDTFIRRQGKEAYLERVRVSRPYIDFALARFLAEQRDPASPRAKQQVVGRILPYLARIANRIERAEYVGRVASRLQVDERLILEELGKMSRRQRSQAPPALQVDAVTPAEETLLRALLDEKWREEARAGLQMELLEGLSLRPLFAALFELLEAGSLSVPRLRDRLEEEDRKVLERIVLGSHAPLGREQIEESIRALEKKHLEGLSRQIQGEIARAEQAGGSSPELEALLRRKEDVRRRLIELDSGQDSAAPPF